MKKLLCTLIALITLNSFSQNKDLNNKPFIEVSGQADTLVAPNKIWINVLLMEKDTKGKKSVEDLEKEMIGKLQEIGINTEKNVTLNDMASNFKNYLFKQTDILKSKSYSIVVNDAKTTSKVFIELEEIGISNVRIDRTENTEVNKIKLLINAKAILNAKQTAESLSKPLNQTIGNAIQISNFENISNQLSGMVSGVTIRGVSSQLYGSRSSNYESNIDFEKIKILSSVQARFSLE